ncbi:hypothetical protein U1Q18_045273 [Sarracenia purpurea var. burkii]
MSHRNPNKPSTLQKPYTTMTHDNHILNSGIKYRSKMNAQTHDSNESLLHAWHWKQIVATKLHFLSIHDSNYTKILDSNLYASLANKGKGSHVGGKQSTGKHPKGYAKQDQKRYANLTTIEQHQATTTEKPWEKLQNPTKRSNNWETMGKAAIPTNSSNS